VPPSGHGASYADALTRIVAGEKIDCIVPTCEEVFQLSMTRGMLPTTCSLFVDDISKLRQFHDKYTFLSAAKGCGIGIPRTLLVRSWRRLSDSWEREMIDTDIVYKRCFKRFGDGALVKPKIDAVNGLRPSPSDPWVAQEFISGEEFCCYAVAVAGKLTAISTYRPRHRTKNGVDICFEPLVVPEIESFVSRFIGKHAFSGQISFDFIVSTDRGAFVLGCNLQATSGVHLLPSETDWDAVFSGSVNEPIRSGKVKAMAGLELATYALAKMRKAGRVLGDFVTSRDVIMRKDDPLPAFGQIVATSEILLRAARLRIRPLAATTSDIGWNGPLP
jgi:hypothetical protein